MVRDIRKAGSTEQALKILDDKIEAQAKKSSPLGPLVAPWSSSAEVVAAANTRAIWANISGLSLSQGAWYRITYDVNLKSTTSGTNIVAVVELAFATHAVSSPSDTGLTYFYGRRWDLPVGSASAPQTGATGSVTFQATSTSSTVSFIGVIRAAGIPFQTATFGGDSTGAPRNSLMTIERIG